MLIIPFRNETPFFDEVVTLDGVPYLLTFRYNTRLDGWFMDIATSTGVPIVSGIRIVSSLYLFTDIGVANLPAGNFIAIDPSGETHDITFENMGAIYQLVYVTETEFEELYL